MESGDSRVLRLSRRGGLISVDSACEGGVEGEGRMDNRRRRGRSGKKCSMAEKKKEADLNLCHAH